MIVEQPSDDELRLLIKNSCSMKELSGVLRPLPGPAGPKGDAASAMEVGLKKLVDNNPREIRPMYIGFRDLVQELDYN